MLSIKYARKNLAHLTVGHEDILEGANSVVQFSKRILQHEHVRLLPVSEFDGYAQEVRTELLM